MPKVLVLIVAYDAETHLDGLLARLPPECLRGDGYHLLVIDDASSDRSAATATTWLEERGAVNATVLRNPVNQGYGGNQKLGYRYAVDAGYDLVILLHGDGQYAPELIPQFVETFERTGADVVLGSRMRLAGSARQGGMPRYKVVGNRILTGLQNLITGRRLSEYHTGYRAYSGSFLRSVPFELDTNDFHFDTEILLQAFTVGARIEEIDIPTHYGDEVCHVNGVRYAAAALAATTVYRMHHLGMLCSLKHRDLRSARYRSKSSVPYSSHARALELVRKAAPETLLDLGCGPGHVAQRCEEMGVRVTGVDHERPLPGRMSEFHLADLEQPPLPVDPQEFDMVLLLDVIEHLKDPEGFLLALRNASGRPQVDPETRVVLTTPNVAFAAVRLNLLLGRFNYAERGILDITHKRLFTRRSLLTALEDCGYRVERLEGVGVPIAAVFGGRWARPAGAVADLLARLWPSLFAFQLLVVCRPLAGVRQLLAASERHLEQRRPPATAQSI